MNKMMGITLIIVGTGLFFWGYDIYNSAGSQIGRSLGGDAPIKAYALMVGGVIAIVIGAMRLK